MVNRDEVIEVIRESRMSWREKTLFRVVRVRKETNESRRRDQDTFHGFGSGNTVCQTALGNNRYLARRRLGGFETRPYKYS